MTADLEFRYAEPAEAWEVVDRIVDRFQVFSGPALNDEEAYRLVAYHSHHPAGMFVFQCDGLGLLAAGTVVTQPCRSTDIGTALWLRAIDDLSVTRVDVSVVSAYALRMIRRIEVRRPSVKIYVTMGGADGGVPFPQRVA